MSTRQQAPGPRERMYRALFDGLPDAHLVITAGLITDCNRAAESLLRRTRDQIVGLAAHQLSPPIQPDGSPSAQAFEAHIERALASSSHTFEWQYQRLAGPACDVEVSVRAIVLGGGRSLLTSFRDVSARKVSETARGESEARLRAISDAAQNAILMIDPRGIITHWNPAAETTLGYQADEALGQNLHSLLAPARFHDQHRTAFARFVTSGQGPAVGRTVELAAICKDGREIAVSLSLSALELGGEWHAVGILRDITEQKLAQKQLVRANQDLEAAIARANSLAVEAQIASIAKSSFLANMSHEIRTPMNGVIGMTGMLLDTDLDDEQRRLAEVARSSGESLLALINDILDFSKIEAGKLDLEILDFDLHSLMADLAATLALKAEEKGLEIICAADPDVPAAVRGDPGRLRQVLTNLAGNALKFTTSGEVAIRATLAATDEDGVLIRFGVRDTGIGIPASKIGLLFTKFQQVDASTTRQFGGTGLGLAISKQLAELMGGAIGVTSRESEGSEFWFTARMGLSAAQRTAPPVPAKLRGVRALIVDDNATNREVLAVSMAAWGMETEAVADGPSALQALVAGAAAERPVRLAVIDMHMPGMNGAELGEAIKADPRLADTALVMLTSIGARGDAKRFEQMGFAAYLAKPVRSDDLRDVLALALACPARQEPGRPITTRHVAREAQPIAVRLSGRVLVVDDNVINQKVALSIVRKLGVQAEAVGDGAEAIAALAMSRFDAVLMDVQMPGMDGLEATRRIRSGASAVLNSKVPIVAMTANAMAGDREECLEAGMDSYVAKPVRPDQLAKALMEWLRPAGDAQPDAGPVDARASFGTEGDNLRDAVPTYASGGGHIVAQALEAFRNDMALRAAVLCQALAANDATSVHLHAVSVQLAAAKVGAEAIEEVARLLDQAVVSGSYGTARRCLRRLAAAIEQLPAELGLTGDRQGAGGVTPARSAVPK